jgi:hypothetical protein
MIHSSQRMRSAWIFRYSREGLPHHGDRRLLALWKVTRSSWRSISTSTPHRNQTRTLNPSARAQHRHSGDPSTARSRQTREHGALHAGRHQDEARCAAVYVSGEIDRSDRWRQDLLARRVQRRRFSRGGGRSIFIRDPLATSAAAPQFCKMCNIIKKPAKKQCLSNRLEETLKRTEENGVEFTVCSNCDE